MLFNHLPSYGWASEKLKKVADQVGHMVEHPKSKSDSPGAGPPCSLIVWNETTKKLRSVGSWNFKSIEMHKG